MQERSRASSNRGGVRPFVSVHLLRALLRCTFAARRYCSAYTLSARAAATGGTRPRNATLARCRTRFIIGSLTLSFRESSYRGMQEWSTGSIPRWMRQAHTDGRLVRRAGHGSTLGSQGELPSLNLPNRSRCPRKPCCSRCLHQLNTRSVLVSQCAGCRINVQRQPEGGEGRACCFSGRGSPWRGTRSSARL